MGGSSGFLLLAVQLKYATQHSSRSSWVRALRGEMVGDRDGSRLVHGAHFRQPGVIGCRCAGGVRMRPMGLWPGGPSSASLSVGRTNTRAGAHPTDRAFG